ncbi:MAG: hypothetical protein P1U30_05200 [Phycisphaerales bacterium]|nr:hypothetical protein [Phycisphaerales bacterium]
MFSTRTKKHLTWAILISQAIMLLIGQGRVILCHDDSGSTHIEFTSNESCSTTQSEGCNQIASVNEGFQSQECSGTTCVDELLTLNATPSTLRKANLDLDNASTPPLPVAFLSWIALPDPTRFTYPSVHFDESIVQLEQLRSIRTTVLVL